MSDIESLVTGLSNGINGYLGKQQQIEGQKEVQDNGSKNSLDNSETLELYKQTLAGKVDPKIAAQINPKAASMVDDFHNSNGRLPSIDEFNSLLSNAGGDGQPTDKQLKEQNDLEKQAMDRMTMVRGDTSLLRTEHQRDAAGMGYDTIAKAQSEGRDLTQLEQSDLAGQLWQARTGKAPTDQDMKEIQDRTAKRGWNHVVTYLTGDPKLVGASTSDTLANLKQFVDATGQKADQQWNAYMGPRMVKPTRLDPERWDHITKVTRGLSYADQKSTTDKTYVQTPEDDIETKKSKLRTKLGI